MEFSKQIPRILIMGMLLLGTGALLLGCGDDELEEIGETAGELEEIRLETVEELNLLLEQERELQTRFEETMEEDDDLTSFNDGSASVFENLALRREGLERLKELEEAYTVHGSTLREYDGGQLDEDPLGSLGEEVDGFSKTLGEFRSEYSRNLEEQQDYFEGLADEETTYDDFRDGIEELNAQHQELREYFYELDEGLRLLGREIGALQGTLEELQEIEE